MRKIALCGLVGVCILSATACAGKSDDVSTVRTTEVVETVTEKETEDIVESEVETTEAITEEINSVADKLDEFDEVVGTNDGDIELEPVVYAKVIDEGSKTLDNIATDNLYTVGDLMGYKFQTIRPFDYQDAEKYGDYSDILSYDLVKGDAVFHKHVMSEEEEEPGYYYDNPKEGPCWVEEQLNIVLYTKEMQETSMIYEDGEDFTDWLDNYGTTLVFGEDANVYRVEYNTSDRNWVAYYSESNTSKDLKDVFSPVICFAYSQEANGDYVTVELRYSDFPTQSVDTHLPTFEERMNGAREEFETVLFTIVKN